MRSSSEITEDHDVATTVTLLWRERARAGYGGEAPGRSRSAGRGSLRAVEPSAVESSAGESSAGAPSATPPVASALTEVLASPDEIEALGEEIATLAARIHATTRRFLDLIARFDRLRGWEAAGHRSCAHWLAYRTGLDPGTAREHVRVARALTALPLTGASMARGALSFSKVRALTRVAEAETEPELLELAEGATAAELERVVRAWKRHGRREEAERERARHRARKLSVFPDEEGMYVVRGRLDPEVGAVLLRALEAATDALYRRERCAAAGAEGRGARRSRADGAAGGHAAGGGAVGEDATRRDVHGSARPAAALDALPGEEPTEREAARRRADAIGLLAERALAAGLGRTSAAGSERDAGRRSQPEGREPSAAPVSGTRAERFQVVLHVEPATLAAEGEPGRSELEDGTRVSAETSRRLACDAGVVRIDHAPDGSVLDVGRRTRTVPPALRRALETRDRGCRFPGCGLRFTEAHHLVHWADGGETSLGNTVLLCRHHHRLVHEEGWQVEWWDQERRPAFRDPRGQVHVAGAARPPALDPAADPAAELAEELRRRGVTPGPYTASARWKRERDIPDRVLFRALEAAL